MKPNTIKPLLSYGPRLLYKRAVHLRSRALVMFTHRLALPLLRLIRRPEVFAYSKEQLHAFPKGTLGNDLVCMLEAGGLELLTYYAKHDMKHILLGYPTTDEGEVCLQVFMLGNGHFSFPVGITVFFGLLTMPEYWSSFRAAWRRGKRAAPISGWNWPELVHYPTEVLQQKIFTDYRPN
jgi:ubiquinone biosynthesis protein Coq4